MINAKQKHNIILIVCVLWCAVLLCATACLFLGCVNERDDQVEYIIDRDSFLSALSNGQSEIYVGDIDFGEPLVIAVNSDVKIIGKSEKSLLKNAYFKLTGESVASKAATRFEFRDLIFDGGVELSAKDFSGEKSWIEIFGEHNMHCLELFDGYCELTLNGCEFTHYAAEIGSCIYYQPPSYGNPSKESKVTVKNCKFYRNAALNGTVRILGHYDYNVAVRDCEFYSNTAKTGSALTLGNLTATLKNINVHDNYYYGFVPAKNMTAEDEGNDYFSLEINGQTRFFPSTACGGAVLATICDIQITDSIFDGCECVKGDALGIVRSKAIIEGCTIKNSIGTKSAVYVASAETKTAYIINTSIVDGNGEALHVFPSIDGNSNLADNKGGTVELAFCEFYGNASASMVNTAISEDKLSTLVYRGCKIVDDALPIQNGVEPNYNIVSVEKSDKTIAVPYDAYKTWANGRLANISGGLNIGVNQIIPSGSSASLWWIWLVGVVVVISITTALILLRRKNVRYGDAVGQEPAVEKQNETLNTQDSLILNEFDAKRIIEECEICKGLSDGEKAVLNLLLTTALTRDNIAKILIVSIVTVKKRIGVIYKNFNCSSRYELLVKANKEINK